MLIPAEIAAAPQTLCHEVHALRIFDERINDLLGRLSAFCRRASIVGMHRADVSSLRFTLPTLRKSADVVASGCRRKNADNAATRRSFFTMLFQPLRATRSQASTSSSHAQFTRDAGAPLPATVVRSARPKCSSSGW